MFWRQARLVRYIMIHFITSPTIIACFFIATKLYLVWCGKNLVEGLTTTFCFIKSICFFF